MDPCLALFVCVWVWGGDGALIIIFGRSLVVSRGHPEGWGRSLFFWGGLPFKIVGPSQDRSNMPLDSMECNVPLDQLIVWRGMDGWTQLDARELKSSSHRILERHASLLSEAFGTTIKAAERGPPQGPSAVDETKGARGATCSLERAVRYYHKTVQFPCSWSRGRDQRNACKKRTRK